MKRVYRGSCHCGDVRFEVDADITQVVACDCSMCRKRGALNFKVPPADVRFLTPVSELGRYEWHTRVAKDYFCKRCGIQPYRRPRMTPDLWTINARCLEDLDLAGVPVQSVTGSQLP